MVAIDSILGYVGFIATLMGWFPDNPDKGQVRLKFYAGRDGYQEVGDPLWGSAGGLPMVNIRSTSNEWIGKNPHYVFNKIGSNEQKQIDIPMSKNQEINFMILTTHDDDASCLALIGWTPNDSIPHAQRRKGFIIGDIFRLCGWAWNYSGQVMEVADSRKTVNINCGWMVARRDGFVGQLNINLDVMADGFIDDYKGMDLCSWGVSMRSGFLDRPATKRSLSSPDEHVTAFGNQVRVHKSLSAIELCDSPTSWGSSFFSIEEGVFCDMSTKTKVPLCKTGETKGCFVYERPIVNGRGEYSTKRTVGVRGSTMKYNATYFVTSDQDGRVVDDGKGY
ncbi:MAG: hypothetical protein J3R72DRAFT_112228 [Linnemannia gamsii]|nr:MAG: hypothetical protein J3R72DRAFT_112228 [Linnemannia gamsii]